MSVEVLRNVLFKLLNKMWPLGARTDEAHVSLENVDELWQLIEAEAAKEPAEPSSAWVIFLRPDGSGVSLGADAHGSEFQAHETIALVTDAFLTIDLTPPSLTYDSGMMHVYLGKREVALVTLPGHTGGDTLAFIPDANIVLMGDIGWTHSLPNLIDATVVDWVHSLDLVLSHHPEARFVPGHGEVGSAAEIRDFRDYLDDLRNRVKAAIDSGMTLDQAKEQLKVPERFKTFNGQPYFVKPNIADMYNELKGVKGK